jgi:hypothetical protein
MVAKTFSDVLRAFSHRRPFRPFMVELVNGEHFIVQHPEALAFNAGKGVYISPSGEFVLFDHEGVADVRDPPPQAKRRQHRPPGG